MFSLFFLSPPSRCLPIPEPRKRTGDFPWLYSAARARSRRDGNIVDGMPVRVRLRCPPSRRPFSPCGIVRSSGAFMRSWEQLSRIKKPSKTFAFSIHPNKDFTMYNFIRDGIFASQCSFQFADDIVFLCIDFPKFTFAVCNYYRCTRNLVTLYSLPYLNTCIFNMKNVFIF